MEVPRNPPRPTASVINRARGERNARLAVPSMSDDIDLDSVHSYGSSSSGMSSRSYPRSRPPRQKIKKSKSQSAADEKFQATRPPHSNSEAPPQNGVVGGASGGVITCDDAFTATLIKHILESPDPNLKAKLKNLLENNEGMRNSLADMLQ